ncbi:hypothetical protein J7J95_03795 [bacterium]|nr:hypothetical protein [bacterium]
MEKYGKLFFFGILNAFLLIDILLLKVFHNYLTQANYRIIFTAELLKNTENKEIWPLYLCKPM